MANPGLIKSYDAQGVINPRRLVVHGAADYAAAEASGDGAAFLGVSEQAAIIADGSRADVIKSGQAAVEYGGAVSAGDPLTSDANGKAIIANPGAGVNAWIIGIADVSGGDGDFGLVAIAPGRIQG